MAVRTKKMTSKWHYTFKCVVTFDAGKIEPKHGLVLPIPASWDLLHAIAVLDTDPAMADAGSCSSEKTVGGSRSSRGEIRMWL